MHHAYLDVLSMGNLLPFAGGLFCSFVPMWTAFPSSDYYGSSVTIGLSPRRQSRALLAPYCRMVLGGLFVPLWGFVTLCSALEGAYSPHGGL